MLKSVRFVYMMFSVVILPTAQGADKPVRVNKVVYGDDNRIEVYQASERLQKAATATAAMVPIYNLEIMSKDPVTNTPLEKMLVNLSQNQLKEEGVCSTERFSDQPIPAVCSGFLVGPDLLATAGHCVRQYMLCERFVFVFNFKVDKDSKKAGLDINPRDVYRCKQVINGQLNNPEGIDHGLVQLERVVEGVEPLKFRSSGRVSNDSELVVIGHPSGLPAKIAGAGKIRKNEHENYFEASMDTFHGNSGSVVLNSKDLTVEGILVRGEDDYEFSPEKSCDVVKVCKEDECRGEDISRIDGVIELKMRDEVLEAAKVDDINTINKYLELKGFVDMYNNERESILTVAAQNGNLEIAEILLSKGADVNHVDLKKRTPLHHAVMGSVDSLGMIDTLVAKGAKVDQVDNQGATALSLAVSAKKLEVAKSLIAQGADVNKMIENEALILRAIRNDDLEMAGLLIENKVKLDVSSMDGLTPVALAKKLKVTKIKRLLKREIRERKKSKIVGTV